MTSSKSAARNSRYPLGNTDALKTFILVECPFTEPHHTVREGDTLQTLTMPESPISHTCHTFRNNNFRHKAASHKCIISDACHPFANRQGGNPVHMRIPRRSFRSTSISIIGHRSFPGNRQDTILRQSPCKLPGRSPKNHRRRIAAIARR